MLSDPNASTIVNVNIYLRTINDINDYKMVSEEYAINHNYDLHFLFYSVDFLVDYIIYYILNKI